MPITAEEAGLLPSDLEQITAVLRQYPHITEAILYGSRAKGTWKPGSDVDLALRGTGAAGSIARIAAHLNEETLLPYHFDVLSYDDLRHPELKQHIDRVGKVVYSSAAHAG